MFTAWYALFSYIKETRFCSIGSMKAMTIMPNFVEIGAVCVTCVFN